MNHLKTVIGKTRRGTPVYAIRGGSGEPPPPPQQQQQTGDTITVSENQPPPPQTQTGGEQPPATPAPTRVVDPGAFNRGADEQHNTGQQDPPPGQQRQPTWEDVEKARQQEKDKLYTELHELREEQRRWREEREAEQAARQQQEEEAQRAADEAKKKGEESDLDVRELIVRKEEEWNQRFEQIRQEQQRAEAMLEQERKLNALKDYKQAQLEAHGEDIMPHLRDLVDGTSEEEIDAAVERAKEKTAAILQDVQAAHQQQFQQVPSTRVTAPGDGGPMEQTAGTTRTFSAEDIQKMSVAEYARYRDQLRGAAAAQGPYGQQS